MVLTKYKKAISKKSIPKSAKTGVVDKTSASNTTTSDYDKLPICASIRSPDEPQFRCLMRAKNGEKYCPMHLCQKNIINYKNSDIPDTISDKFIESKKIINPIIRKINLDNPQPIQTVADYQKNDIPKSQTVLHEHKISTITNTYQKNEDELEIKLLILVNEYSDKLSELIGPVFHDITLSEDAQDPITYDEFWCIQNGKKVPSIVNKYYLFSYKDKSGKIRCLTVFSLYNMMKENRMIHPVTMEVIPRKAVERAKKLIDLYDTKVGLFNKDDSILSPEFKLRNRIAKLFKQFHIHNIYLEENWLLDLNDADNLYKIIKETERLVLNNLNTINPNLHGFAVFQREKPNSKKMAKISKDDILELKEYIVEEWEKIIQAADNPQNQIPIWIIASGLSFAVPEVKQKYPNLEIMI